MKRTEEEWKRIYRERLTRIARLAALKAPPIVMAHEAAMLIESYRKGWWKMMLWFILWKYKMSWRWQDFLTRFYWKYLDTFGYTERRPDGQRHWKGCTHDYYEKLAICDGGQAWYYNDECLFDHAAWVIRKIHEHVVEKEEDRIHLFPCDDDHHPLSVRWTVELDEKGVPHLKERTS